MTESIDDMSLTGIGSNYAGLTQGGFVTNGRHADSAVSFAGPVTPFDFTGQEVHMAR